MLWTKWQSSLIARRFNLKKTLLSEMLFLATEAHHGQFDRGGLPYILHPLAVMHMLRSDDEELQCIALGHDLLEDTYVTYDLLYQKFGSFIANVILLLTKTEGQRYEDYKQAVFSSNAAMLVKACDLRHNSDITRLKGVTKKDIERTAKYHVFYSEIKERLGSSIIS